MEKQTTFVLKEMEPSHWLNFGAKFEMERFHWSKFKTNYIHGKEADK